MDTTDILELDYLAVNGRKKDCFYDVSWIAQYGKRLKDFVNGRTLITPSECRACLDALI